MPTTIWAEAVNTACYVLNRVLVIKPHIKTPYELIHGRPLLIDFMKPFGCPVTILNTRDHLGKFDRKADEGFFCWVPCGPKTSEEDIGMKPTEVDESGASDKDGMDEQATRNDAVGPSFINAAPSSPFKAIGTPVSTTNAFEEHLFKRFSPFKNAFALPHVPNVSSINDTGIFSNAYDDEDVEEEVDMNNVVSSYTVPDTPFIKFHKDHPEDQVIGNLKTLVRTRQMTKINEEHDLPKDKWAIGTKWVFRNKKYERGIVVKNKARLVAQGHTQEEGIDYDEVFAPVERIEAIKLFLAYASFKDFIVYQMDVKSAFLYRKIEEEAPRAWYETLSTYLLDNGFHRGQIDKTLFIKKDKGDILLVQVYVDDIIFRSTKKELSTEFEKLMHDKFQMSSMGELSFFLGLQVQQKSDRIFISHDKYVADILKKFDFATVKIASTPMEPNNALIKDEEAEDNAFRWKETVGPWEERPGHYGDVWFYWTNDGLGRYEFFLLAEETIQHQYGYLKM
ncbi:putative ribonuclease H-like domain-containing protein, partial [Tanacetum coccineum]